VLEGKGRVSHDDAVKKAEGVYAEFRIKQDEAYISEFDRDMAKYLKGDKSGQRCLTSYAKRLKEID